MIASGAWIQLPDHWALLPLDNSYRTINILTAFFSAMLNSRSIYLYELVFFVARAGFQVPVLAAVEFRW